MRVAINISALTSGHRHRGVGSYTEQLVSALSQYEPDISYTKIDSSDTVQEKVDIIHYTYLDLFNRTIKLSPNLSTIITIHDVIPLVFPQHFPVGVRGSINLFLLKNTLKHVDAVLTDSKQSKKDIIKYLSIPNDVITVVPLAAGGRYKKLSQSQRKARNIQKKYHLAEKYLLYVGDVNWNKNLVSLIHGFKKADQKNLSLVMVGRALADPYVPETQNIIQTIESLNLTNVVSRLGFLPQDDLVYLYNEAYGYIQPSYYEGFGFPVLEAMQCGVPVISSSTSSLAELVGDASIPINPYSVDSIAGGIEKLVSLSTSDRTALINKGFTQAKQFSWEQVAHKTADVYRQVYNKQ